MRERERRKRCFFARRGFAEAAIRDFIASTLITGRRSAPGLSFLTADGTRWRGDGRVPVTRQVCPKRMYLEGDKIIGSVEDL